MIQSTDDLLLGLGWPKHHLAQKGVLAWPLQGENPSSPGLTVVVTPFAIRARSAPPPKSGLPTMNAMWAIDPRRPPELRAVARQGSVIAVDSAEAVQLFRDIIAQSQATPTIQAAGLRWPAAQR